MMTFLRGLYASSKFSIPTGNGDEYQIPLERGLRQGCPLSPVLFNLYINNVFGQEGDGIRVLHGRWDHRVRATQEGESRRCNGLAFADDLAVLGDTPDDLATGVARVETWANASEMEFGIRKCGVMVVGDAEAPIVEINGEALPIVEEYMYLGVLIRKDLDLEAMVSFRTSVMRRRLNAASSFLKSQSIPIMSRVAVLKAMIVPSFLYGSEIFGMSETRVTEAQKLLDRGVRYIVGIKVTDMILNREIALRELAIPPIHVSASALRGRLLRKATTLRTWIKWVVEHPMTGTRRRTWLSLGIGWLRRNARYYLLISDGDNGRESDLGPMPEGYDFTVDNDLCKARLWDQYDERRRDLVNVNLYTRRYHFSRFRKEWQRVALSHPELGREMNLFCKARLRALWTTRQRAQAGMMEGHHLGRCPFCDEVGICENGEDLTHILLGCSEWDEVRDRYLLPHIRYIRAVILYLHRAPYLEMNREIVARRVDPFLGQHDFVDVPGEVDPRAPAEAGLYFEATNQWNASAHLRDLSCEELREIRGVLLAGAPTLHGRQGSVDVFEWYNNRPEVEAREQLESIIIATARYLGEVFLDRNPRLAAMGRQQQPSSTGDSVESSQSFGLSDSETSSVSDPPSEALPGPRPAGVG